MNTIIQHSQTETMSKHQYSKNSNVWGYRYNGGYYIIIEEYNYNISYFSGTSLHFL